MSESVAERKMNHGQKIDSASDSRGAIVSDRFCAGDDTTLELWISSNRSSILVGAHSSYGKRHDGDAEDAEIKAANGANRGGALIAFQRSGPTSRFGTRDFTLRDASGNELLRIRRQASAAWRNLYLVYRGEKRVMSIREGNVSHWNHNLHVFLEKPADGVGGASVNAARPRRHANPDYKLRRLTGLYYSRNVVLGIYDGKDDRKMAEAQMYPHSWLSWRSILGQNPDYRVTISSGVDQAFVALLLNLYNIIASDNREIHGGL